jgi:hypothetical protein
MIKRQLLDPQREPDVVTMQAVNRRGRGVELQVTVSPLSEEGHEASGAILVTDMLTR